MKKHIPLLFTVFVGLAIWFLPKPDVLSDQAWHLLAIFIATIVGIILRPLPMGAVAIIALAVVTITDTLTMKQALEGFSNKMIWLIVIAFFISHGLIKTRLGTRIAYMLVGWFGKTSLGLSYSFVISEVILAPAVPSVTARTGGIIYPIANALSQALDSKPNHPTSKKLGEFLMLVCFQASIVACAMFLTAMAANPIVKDLAADLGVVISWRTWAMAGLLPGLVSLTLIPLVLYALCKPTLKALPDAQDFSRKHLKALGPMSSAEWIMLGVFVFLIFFWVMGDDLGIDPLTTALLGVTVLLVTRVVGLAELLEIKSAWSTYLWFGVLFTLAAYLNRFGVIEFFSSMLSNQVSGLSWPLALSLLAAIYFYSHYFFASSMAHVGAMYAVFVTVAIQLGTPPMFAALSFAFLSNLFGGLTHYGIGSAPVLFGGGYVSTKDWWKYGLIISILNLTIWSSIGPFWWKYLGFWG